MSQAELLLSESGPGPRRAAGFALLGERLWRPASALLLPLAGAIGWEAGAEQGLIDAHLLPPPSQLLATFAALLAKGEAVQHIAATGQRVALGFFFGMAAGTVLGATTGYFDLARRLLDPSVQALRSVPPLAWVPLFILWFGIFETSKVMLIAVGVFFPVYLNLAGAMHGVDRKLVEVGRVHGLSHARIIRRVLLPAALPGYLIGLRSGLGLGWMFVVAAEFMGASEGLGFLLVDGQMMGRPTTILVAIVLFAVIGKSTDFAVAIVSARLLRWQDAFKPSGSA